MNCCQITIDRDYFESSGKNSRAVTSGVSQKNLWGVNK